MDRESRGREVTFSARIGPENRERVLAYAHRWDMTIAEATRALAILGLGGTWDDVLGANHGARVRRDALAENVRRFGNGAEINQPRQHGAFIKPSSMDVVSTNLTTPWADAIVERGSFKTAVLAGLARADGGV